MANAGRIVNANRPRDGRIFVRFWVISEAPARKASVMTSAEKLCHSKCKPCEGGVPTLSEGEAEQLHAATPEWSINPESTMITRKVNCKNFVRAVSLLNQIAEVAEADQHHPDLHLTGYRHLRIDLTTHAIGGLSENDFIVAAKIDQLL